jgi:hypothetical protein
MEAMTDINPPTAHAEALANQNSGVARCDDCDRPLAKGPSYVFEPNGDYWILCQKCFETSSTK